MSTVKAVVVLVFCVMMGFNIAITVYLHNEWYSNELIFDVGNATHGHEVMGFGANVWNGDSQVHGLVHDLNLKYARMFYGSSSPPDNVTGFTRADYDAIFAGLPLSATIDMLQAHSVSVIVTPGIPGNWLDSSKTIKPEYLQPIAMIDGALVDAMARLGQAPAFIEPFNEPDGDWSGHVPPASYNTVVKALRAELDARGLHSVGIDGPGLAHVDLEGRDIYVDTLDVQGVAAISAWALHGWEWSAEARADMVFFRKVFADGFIKSIHAKDPGRTKPVFITEYSTFAYNNVDGVPDSVSIPFAIRVVENTLSFLNGGANALVYWQGADQSWDPTNIWSFLRLNGTGRPVFQAAKILYPKIPIGARVVPIDNQAYGAYASVFSTGNATILMLVNRHSSNQTITVRAKGMENAHLVEAVAFESGNIVNKSLAINLDAFQMPPLSLLTLVFGL